MNNRDEEAKIADHIKFWKREKTTRPLASFHLGNVFFATHYRAAKHLLVSGKKISPDMIDVDSFLEDYERMYREVCLLDQGAFWTAEPFTSVPWMEAFWGCDIYGNENSLVSHPFVKNPQDLDKLRFSMDNPWVQKYFEFVKKLDKLSQGRFPVAQPVMRGQGDTAGALLGQTELIFAMCEEPEIIRRLLDRVTDSFLAVNGEMHRLAAPFHGGSAIGFYNIWTPEKCVWFQDDICALLSPSLYTNFLLENEKRICAAYEYSLVHIHPASFFTLDSMLTNEKLRAVQINRDNNGPSLKQMLPQFRKVLEKGKNLVLWGFLDERDIDLIYSKLPPEGIFFFLSEYEAETAKRISDYLNAYF
ncbi:MAG: hypothetical protein LBS57_06980 [Treponema sp.]|jgi:hypothetical protein|nr:hypothetical protein [Treponema sp.]